MPGKRVTLTLDQLDAIKLALVFRSENDNLTELDQAYIGGALEALEVGEDVEVHEG